MRDYRPDFLSDQRTVLAVFSYSSATSKFDIGGLKKKRCTEAAGSVSYGLSHISDTRAPKSRRQNRVRAKATRGKAKVVVGAATISRYQVTIPLISERLLGHVCKPGIFALCGAIHIVDDGLSQDSYTSRYLNLKSIIKSL